MKNQGISLISLIITIIVIIILAAIVIFTGFGATDSATFARFCQDYGNVNDAVLSKYAQLLEKHGISGDQYTQAQIYNEVATGSVGTDINMANGYVRINETASGIKLPSVSGQKEWYVTSTGKIFNVPGFVYDKKVYTTPNLSHAMPANGAADFTDATAFDLVSGDSN